MIKEQRNNKQVMICRKNSANLLTKRLRMSIEACPRSRRYLGVDVEVEVLVTGASNRKVGAGIYHPLYPVLYRCCHHVIAASCINIERNLPIRSKNGQVDDSIHTFCRCCNSIKIRHIQLDIFMNSFWCILYISKAKLMKIL